MNVFSINATVSRRGSATILGLISLIGGENVETNTVFFSALSTNTVEVFLQILSRCSRKPDEESISGQHSSLRIRQLLGINEQREQKQGWLTPPGK